MIKKIYLRMGLRQQILKFRDKIIRFENNLVRNWKINKFGNLFKIWISLINKIRRINKFVDLIKLWFN